MNSNNFIKIKRPTKPVPKPQRLAEDAVSEEVEPMQPLEIEQPEQPEPTVHLESLAEVTPDESVYGSGWTVTELLNEFSGR